MGSITDTIILVFIALSTSWYYNNYMTSQEIYVIDNNGIMIEVIFDEKGVYFCPSCCGVNHLHHAHQLNHDCGLKKCNHKTFISKHNQKSP